MTWRQVVALVLFILAALSLVRAWRRVRGEFGV
jgi:hypothetical protein